MIGHPPPVKNPYDGWRFIGWTKLGPFGRMVVAPPLPPKKKAQRK